MPHHSDAPPPATTRVTVNVDGVSRVFTWEDGAEIHVRASGREVVIAANTAGLRTLANHLSLLATDGTPDGCHLHLEDGNGLQAGSVGLVLERDDEL
jgi:hypothetical protein